MKYENQMYTYIKMIKYIKYKITWIYKYASMQVRKLTKNKTSLAN